MGQPDTKERILDAAEMLFARDGYHFASMRAITKEAGANIAAINYHFGSKEALLEEVMKRRLIPLNAIRRERLEAVRALASGENRLPGVEDVLRAFFEPTIEFCCREPAGQHFSTLIGRAIAEPDSTVRNVFIQYIMPLFNLLFEMLQQSLPHLDADSVFWRLNFCLGSVTHMMRVSNNREFLPEGLNREITLDKLFEEFLSFVSAGVNR